MNHTGNDGRCRRAPVSPVAVIALVMFTATLSSNLPSPRYVLYQQRFAFSAATLTYVFSAYAVAVLVALVTVGRASDRVGRKRVIVPALVLLVVSALVFMTADGTASLVAARAVQGSRPVRSPPPRLRRWSSLSRATTAGGRRISAPRRSSPAPRSARCYPAFSCSTRHGPGYCRSWSSSGCWPSRWCSCGPSRRRCTPHPESAGGCSACRSPRRSGGRSPPPAARSPRAGRSPCSTHRSAHRPAAAPRVPSHVVAGALLFVFSGLGGLAQARLQHWPSRRTMVVGVGALSVGIALVGLSLPVASVLVFGIGTLLAGVGGGLSFMGSLALLNDVAPVTGVPRWWRRTASSATSP